MSGTIGDLDNVSLNEVVNASNGVGVTVKGAAVSNFNLLVLMDLKLMVYLSLNLMIQLWSNVSAQDKVRQINDKTSEHGVIATAELKLKWLLT